MPAPTLRRYAAAGGVVVDPVSGSVLVLVVASHAGHGDRPEARLPKGHIEAGESPAEAAVREVIEETGLPKVHILADLGRQTVEFDDAHRHTVREESYFLMALASHEEWGEPEPRYARSWLTWEEAIDRLTYEPEREWVSRAHRAWAAHGIALGLS